jgi:response regulator of citrate/malate metabolism
MGVQVKNVLIAEDEAIIALDIKFALSANSYNVVGTARSYENVEKLIKKHSPELLISSLSLNKSRNYFNEIISLQKEYNFGVIFLSSFLDLSPFKTRANSSDFKYLKKPFKPEALITSIKSFDENK